MNKKLENFCKEFGYDVNGQVGYGIVNGYEVNIYLEQDYSYPVRVHISTFITDEQKSRVKAELDAKNIKRLNVSFDRYGLVLGLNDTTMGKLMTRLNDIIKGAIETLKNAEALDFEYCPVCAMKFDETNKKCCVINGVRITLDNECISEINQEIESRNKEFDSQPNNISKGLGGALIGALVGAIITFILFLLGYVATISGIVAVWLGCFLYKKFGGKANAYMYAIVSGVTLVFLLGTCLLMYIQVSSVLIENKTGIEAFKEAMLQNEFKAEFIKNMFMIFVFTAIGIVCAIIDEVRKNKRQSGI